MRLFFFLLGMSNIVVGAANVAVQDSQVGHTVGIVELVVGVLCVLRSLMRKTSH